MDRLGGLVVIAPARRGGGPGSNPGQGENFSLKLLKLCIIFFFLCFFLSLLDLTSPFLDSNANACRGGCHITDILFTLPSP